MAVVLFDEVKQNVSIHTKNAKGDMEVQLHAFFTSVLGGGDWLISRPGRFTPRRKEPPVPVE